MKPKVTQEELKRLLNYDPETGVFTYISQPNPKIKIGSIAGNLNPGGYVQIKIRKVLYRAHRLAWLYVHGEHPEGLIDHINHNTADNRLENLRVGTCSDNQGNRVKAPSHSRSGALGVYWMKRNSKWAAQITVKKERKFLGLFNSIEEASDAYVGAKRKFHAFCTI